MYLCAGLVWADGHIKPKLHAAAVRKNELCFLNIRFVLGLFLKFDGSLEETADTVARLARPVGYNT